MKGYYEIYREVRQSREASTKRYPMSQEKWEKFCKQRLGKYLLLQEKKTQYEQSKRVKSIFKEYKTVPLNQGEDFHCHTEKFTKFNKQ